MGGLTAHLPPCATKSTRCHPSTAKTTERHWQRSCPGSKSPSGPGSSWTVLFLAFHLFTSCFLLTQAQDGEAYGATGPPASPDPTAPTKKGPPPPPPFITKKVLANLRPSRKKPTTPSLVASQWTPGTPSTVPDVSDPDGPGHPFAPVAPRAKFVISMEPNVAVVGGHITLIPGEMIGITSCTWFRGDGKTSEPIATFMLPPVSTMYNNVSYSGRESIGKDCSLHIGNLSPKDTGVYTIRTTGNLLYEEAKIKVEVKDADPEEKKSGGLSMTSIGAIVGGAVGAVLLIGLFGICLMSGSGSPPPPPPPAENTEVQPQSTSISRRASRAGRMSRRASQKNIQRKKSLFRGRGSLPGHGK